MSFKMIPLMIYFDSLWAGSSTCWSFKQRCWIPNSQQTINIKRKISPCSQVERHSHRETYKPCMCALRLFGDTNSWGENWCITAELPPHLAMSESECLFHLQQRDTQQSRALQRAGFPSVLMAQSPLKLDSFSHHASGNNLIKGQLRAADAHHSILDDPQSTNTESK